MVEAAARRPGALTLLKENNRNRIRAGLFRRRSNELIGHGSIIIVAQGHPGLGHFPAPKSLTVKMRAAAPASVKVAPRNEFP